MKIPIYEGEDESQHVRIMNLWLRNRGKNRHLTNSDISLKCQMFNLKNLGPSKTIHKQTFLDKLHMLVGTYHLSFK